MGRKLRVLLLGYGAINRHVAELLDQHRDEVEIVAIARRKGLAIEPDFPGARLIRSIADLSEINCDVIAEAASQSAVAEWGPSALAAVPRFVISSAGALTDAVLYDALRNAAKRHGSRLVVSSGAIAGVDALSAVASAGVTSLSHRIVKPVAGWRGSQAEPMIGPAPAEEVVFFNGSAREAASAYPANANVAAVSALACGIGLDRARVELVADPAASLNRHEITGEGPFGKISILVENAPLPDNPKSSRLAALSLYRAIMADCPGVRF